MVSPCRAWLSTTLLLAACGIPADDAPYPGSADPADSLVTAESTAREIELEAGDSAAVGDVTLTLLEIESDSRCPADVVCVWQGTVVAEIRVRVQETVTDTVIDLERANPVILPSGHAIHLWNVAPGPRATDEPPSSVPYRLFFRIGGGSGG